MPKILPGLFVALSSLPSLLAAQELSRELITDRPDFTESPSAVPVGSAQVELGSTWERSAGSNVLSGPETLVRWGVLERLELRFVLPDYVDSEALDGWGDAALGAKLELGRAGGWEAAVLGHASLGVGGAHGFDGTAANVILAGGRDLGSAWSLGAQIDATWVSRPDEWTFGYTTVLGLALSDAVGAFAEVAVRPVEEGPRAVLAHHGYTFLLGPTVQLDLHGAVGLSDAAPDVLVGIGLSTRVGG